VNRKLFFALEMRMADPAETRFPKRRSQSVALFLVDFPKPQIFGLFSRGGLQPGAKEGGK
jgi:hypothetical protein